MLDALAWPPLSTIGSASLNTFQVAKASVPFIFDNGGQIIFKVTCSVLPSLFFFFLEEVSRF